MIIYKNGNSGTLYTEVGADESSILIFSVLSLY